MAFLNKNLLYISFLPLEVASGSPATLLAERKSLQSEGGHMAPRGRRRGKRKPPYIGFCLNSLLTNFVNGLNAI